MATISSNTVIITATNSAKRRRTTINWTNIDEEIKDRTQILHQSLSRKEISPEDATNNFVETLGTILKTHGLLRERARKRREHHPNQLERTQNKLTQMKKEARRNIQKAPQNFLTLVRAHNKVTKTTKIARQNKSAQKEERAF